MEHNNGDDNTCFSYLRSPVVVKYFEHYTDINQAIAREKQLKGRGQEKEKSSFYEGLGYVEGVGEV